MQQVSAKAFASAIPVDPLQLPDIVMPPRRRARIGFGRLWVLHRRRVLQAIGALAVVAVCGALYEVRAEIAAAATDLYILGERELAHSPFGISQITISGLSLTNQKDVAAALNITPETSIFNFDVDAARRSIEALPAVVSATVRKAYPNHLDVKIVERVPVARWRLDGVTYAIDATGAQITADGDGFTNLPLVVGDDAGQHAMVMIRALNGFPALKKGLVALSRIADRRWDMIYDTGLRVQLPEMGVAGALAHLAVLESKFQLLERDVTVIDLRVPDVLAVKPSEAAAKQLEDIAKANIAKNKVKFNQDADYTAR